MDKPQGFSMLRLTCYWVKGKWRLPNAELPSRCPVIMPAWSGTNCCYNLLKCHRYCSPNPDPLSTCARAPTEGWRQWKAAVIMGCMLGRGCWAAWKNHPTGEAKVVGDGKVWLSFQVPGSRSIVPPDLAYKTQMPT